MPRAAGQIDRAKNEAILQAAADVLAERGLNAPMAMIARRARVSKQTIYNHYGAKMDLIQALVSRRVANLLSPLESPGAELKPEETLTAFARALLRMTVTHNGYAMVKLSIQSAGEMPNLARDVFNTGPRAAIQRLSAFMRTEMEAGRIATDDPVEAAEFFSGMTTGHRQIATLMGQNHPMDDDAMEQRARNVARRFMLAYAP
jgi:TetR/AcrR family transcriptional repressor of mexJK operon